jgi:hypothetical protein
MASVVTVAPSATNVTPEFADLVLLVNPAIEGARFLPIYDLVTGAAFKARRDPCRRRPPSSWCSSSLAVDRLDDGPGRREAAGASFS